MAASAIPGIDVTEYGGYPEGLRNPNVTAGVSPEAQEWARSRGQMGANAGPQPAATAPAQPGRVSALRAGVNNIFGAGESAGSVAGAVRNVASPLMDASGKVLRGAMRVAAPLTAATSAMQGFGTDTEAYAKRFGLENTEPGLLRDMGVRALGVASDIGDNMTFGQAKKYLYRDGLSDPSQPAAPQAPVPQPVTPSLRDPLAAQNAAKITQFNQTPTPAGPNNKVNVELQPNGVKSFSGSNVTGPVEYTGAGAQGLRNSGGVNTMPASNFVGLAPSVEMQLAERRAAMGEAGAPTGLRDNGTDPRSMLLSRLSSGPLSANGARLLAQVMESDNTLRGHQMSAEASRYGHDIAREGHQATSQTARSRLAWENQWKNKEFDNKQDEQTFNQSEARDKNLTLSLEARNTTKNDKGEAIVDRAAVAEQKGAIMNHHASLVQAARARGDHATADALDKAGLAGIPKDSIEKLLAGLEIGKRAEQGKGITPWSGTFNHSANPMDYEVTGVEKNTLTPDMYVTRNGTKIPRRLLDYKNGGNAILPNSMGDSPSSQFSIMNHAKKGN